MFNMTDDDVCVALVVCENVSPQGIPLMRSIFYYKYGTQFSLILVTVKIIFVSH